MVAAAMVVKHYRTDHHKKSISISIIGGSDGPTSIFIAGKHWDKISENSEMRAN